MQNDHKTKKYPLAKAGKRIIAKVLDIAIISCLVLGLGFAIFCTDPNFKWNETLVLEQNWRYGLFVTLMAVVFFGLMLILPRLWNKTIGMKACKLAYTNVNKEKSYLFGLFKHELFIWEIVVFVALIIGWTLTFLPQHQIESMLEGVNSIFVKNLPEGVDKVCYYVGTGFSCLYGIAIIFLIATIVGICIRSGKPAFHDKYSHVYIYSKKQIDSYISVNEYKKQQKENGNAPGAISIDSLEDIDNM